MEAEIHNINTQLSKLARDIELIKQMLVENSQQKEEVELTDWAEEELKQARSRKTKISHEQAKKLIMQE